MWQHQSNLSVIDDMLYTALILISVCIIATKLCIPSMVSSGAGQNGRQNSAQFLEADALDIL